MRLTNFLSNFYQIFKIYFFISQLELLGNLMLILINAVYRLKSHVLVYVCAINVLICSEEHACYSVFTETYLFVPILYLGA